MRLHLKSKVSFLGVLTLMVTLAYLRPFYLPFVLTRKSRQMAPGKQALSQLSPNTTAQKAGQHLPDGVGFDHGSSKDVRVSNLNIELLKSSIPRFKRDINELHGKWIVVTSLPSPMSDVMILANIPGWKVVVVADLQTPANWSHPNCVLLTVERQSQLGFSVTDVLPWGIPARKNVGFLYAISQGAQLIYDTDNVDNNGSLDTLKSFITTTTADHVSGLMYSGLHLFNPYRHFGQPTQWPRGFPHADSGATGNDTYRVSSHWKTPSVQQGIVNGGLDMATTFRLTPKKEESPQEVSLDPAAPPAILPEGTFSPINSQNTLFRHEALWGLLLPMTPTFRICNIWRGYWLQRLLWEIGGRLAFFPPNAHHIQNAHDFLKDTNKEEKMHLSTEKLLDFLADWKCPSSHSFFQCMDLLSLEMAEKGFWGDNNAKLTRLWIADLVMIRYSEPQRVIHKGLKNPEERKSVKNFNLKSRREESLRQGTEVRFFAAWRSAPTISMETNGEHPPMSSGTATPICIKSSSPNSDLKMISERTINKFHNILLIVTISANSSANHIYLHKILPTAFPNIVFCGSEEARLEMEANGASKERPRFSFIDAFSASSGSVPEYLQLICAFKAMQMRYNVTGILVTGSNVLLNLRKIRSHDSRRFWIDLQASNTFEPENGLVCGKAIYQVLVNLKLGETLEGSILAPKAFMKNLNNANCLSHYFDFVGHVFYIPRTFFDNVTFYVKHFVRSGISETLALACSIRGLGPRHELEKMSNYFAPQSQVKSADARIRQTSRAHFSFPLQLNEDLIFKLCMHNFFMR